MRRMVVSGRLLMRVCHDCHTSCGGDATVSFPLVGTLCVEEADVIALLVEPPRRDRAPPCRGETGPAQVTCRPGRQFRAGRERHAKDRDRRGEPRLFGSGRQRMRTTSPCSVGQICVRGRRDGFEAADMCGVRWPTLSSADEVRQR
jgi:hypothetical protein